MYNMYMYISMIKYV